MANTASSLSAAAHPGHGPGQRRSSGFSLIELMIVIGIIAVLAAIAYASFQRNVVESRRKAATACLQEGAQFMERYYTTRLTYVGGAPALGCQNDLRQFYTFPAPGGAATATGYVLTAVPQGQQAGRDTECGTLGINQVGVRTETGTAVNATVCW